MHATSCLVCIGLKDRASSQPIKRLPSLSLKPDCQSTILERSKIGNRDSVNHLACRMPNNIHVVSNIFIRAACPALMQINWTQKIRDHEFQPNFSSQISHDNDFSTFTLVKTPLATFDIFT